jgi:serine/threonine protein kinase
MQENSFFLEKYYIENFLGSGGFGSVYKTTHIASQKTFAIKVDKKRRGNVKQESAILIEIQGGEGIPRVHEVGETEDFTYMIMELLGPSLSKIQKQQGGKFQADTVIPILIQALHRLEYIHSFGIAHRDLKPQQFLLGPSNVLYLVDYGLARKFAFDGNHIPYQSNCSRAGNSTYASLSNHLGIHQTRRDDIESLSYMAVSLMCGKLPWQQTSKLNSSTKWNNVYQIKSTIPLQELCQDCPKEFLSFIRYARALEFHEEPDYEYLRRMLSNAKNPPDLPLEVSKSKSKLRKNKKEDTSSDSSNLELKNVHEIKNRKLVALTKSKSHQIKGKNKFN